MPRPEPTEYKREFWCLTCNPDTKAPAMTALEVERHLREVHQQKQAKLSGKRSGTLFIDGAGGYTNNYEWIIAGVKLLEVASGPKMTQRMIELRKKR